MGGARVPGPCWPTQQLVPSRARLGFQRRMGSEASLRTELEMRCAVSVGGISTQSLIRIALCLWWRCDRVQ